MIGQLLAHLWGDYVLQSQWMADYKRAWWLPCLLHCLLYTIPFALLTLSWQALAAIFATHYLIDRYGLAAKLIWFKNHMAPLGYANVPSQLEWQNRRLRRYWAWPLCAKWGTHNVPDAVAFPLYAVVDNALHLTINYLALRFL